MNSTVKSIVILVLVVFVGGMFFLNRFKNDLVKPADMAANALDDLEKQIVRVSENEPEDIGRELTGLFSTIADAGKEIATEVAGLTTEEERTIGEILHEQKLANLTISKSAKLKHQIEVLAQPFLKDRHRIDLEFTFTILDTPDFAAFAAPGGFIYITTGLMEFYDYDDDALQFVVGHEIGHIDLKHSAANIWPILRGRQLGGDQGQALAELLLHEAKKTYSQNQEYACDVYAYTLMRTLDGMTKERALSGVQGLIRMEEQQGDDAPHGLHPQSSDIAKAVYASMETYMHSHPSGKNRLERLESL